MTGHIAKSRIGRGALAAGLLALVLIGVASADTNTSLGDRSGEGATPFTGLAQSPEANLFTGALTTQIPIKVPPGRKGMTPQLALRYSSAGGPSAFGHGWDLPIGRIDRSTKWGVPRCTGDHTNDFVLLLPSGAASELVEDPPGSNLYRPVVEEAWLEAEFEPTSNSWTVRDRAGLRYTFGDHSSARVSTAPDGPALALNPDGSCAITSSWMLTHIEDTNRNAIDVEWLNTENVAMPSRVHYGGNTNGIDHFYRVQFAYLLRPPHDFITSHRLGVEQRLLYRLATVSVLSDVPAANTSVRGYDFYYFDDNVTSSMLNAVTSPGEPTQTFVYSPPGDGHAPAAAAIDIAIPQGHQYMRRWTDSLEVFDSILDMNGDGKLDLVQSGSFPWDVYLGENDGSDSFGFAGTPIQWSGDNSHGGGQIRNVWVTTGPCDENGWACTVIDTFDITGDGRVDYVVARDAGQPWRVYTGELKADGSWGFSDDPIQWPAPDHMIRRIKDGHTYRDTIDVNGDGLPDFVDIVGGNWSVWLNHGLGFESQPQPYFAAPVGSISHDAGGSTQHMLADFDGDGLADLIEHIEAGDNGCDDFGATYRHDCLRVYRNTGQGFSDNPTTEDLPRWTDGLTVQQNGDVIADLVDINGDSLPDWVERSNDGSSWNVLLNRAGTLSPVSYQTAPPHDAYAAAVWPGGSGALRRTSDHRTEIDLVDLNGDGFLDRVVAGDLNWEVQLNLLSQRPKLLWMMENGLGGTNTISYEPSSRFDHTGGDDQPDLPFVTWVVGATRLNDGLCTPPAQANPFDPAENPCIDQGHEVLSFFEYQDGRLEIEYELDHSGTPVSVIDRGFFGFRRVTRSDIDGNESASVFGQGPLVRGRLLELYFYAGDVESGSLVRYEVNAWASRPASSLRDQVWLSQNGRFTFDLGGTPHIVVTANHDLDDYGNILHTSVLGSSRSQIDTYTTYAVPFGSNGCFPRNRPASVRTEDAGGVRDHRQFIYDGAPLGTLSAANLTSVRAWLDTESIWTTTEYGYDAFANLVLTRDAAGIETTVDYDDGYGTFLYPTIETNGVGHQTVTVTDYQHGKTALSWGADGPATATLFTYDQAGRLVCEARPGDSLGACTFTTTYDLASGPGETSSVTVERKQSGYGTGRTTTGHFDALGRARYSDVRAVVNGVLTTVRRDHVELDAGGRVREKYYPYLVIAGPPSNGSTIFDYHLNGTPQIDPLGRLHRTTHSDGSSTVNEYRGHRVVVLDEEGNRSERVYDALQRVVREEMFEGAALYSSTESEYDGMGRLIATYQNESALPIKAFVYDTLGRRISVTDRDSGTWLYGYDHVGNLVFRDDPKSAQHTQFCYDDAGRVTRSCSLPEDYHTSYSCSQVCSSDQSTYSYDDPGVAFSKGRLTEVVDEAGMFRVLEYDSRGRQLVTQRIIDVDGDSTSARFEYDYNDTDEVVSIRYPDGEVVTTTYDAAGRPISLQNDSGDVYVSGVWYDVFGRSSSIWHGNGARDDRSYFDQTNRHRLSAVGTAIGGGLEMSHIYQYTARGQISAISDFDTGPASNSATFQYDALGRLVAFDHFHDNLDRTYEYDASGNMTRKGTLDFSYGDPQQPAVRPHQMTAVDGQPIGHDANGNRTSNGAGQSYAYDGEDRLETITANGETVELLYAHDNQRRVRIVDDGINRRVTRYYSELIHTEADGKSVKSYFLGGVRIASRTTIDTSWELAAVNDGAIRVASAWHGRPILLLELDGPAQSAALIASVLLLLALATAPRGRAKRVVGIRVRRQHAATLALIFAITVLPWPIVVRPASAQCGAPTPTPGMADSVVHFHGDHLGSTQMVTSADGAVVEQIRYMPFGEVRGRWDGDGNPLGAPAADQVRFAYTGHELEATSGLIYAGSRFYDPVLATFLTPDPAGEFASPYAYVGWDPVNGNDPTGECELLCALVIAFFVGFAIGAADAALAGAGLGDALKAGLINGATSVVGATVLGPASSALSGIDGWGRAVGGALRLASAGYGVYNTVESFRDGEYLAGSRGALQILSAAFGGLTESNAGIGAKESQLPVGIAHAADASPPGGVVVPRMSTLADGFPPTPPSGTVATIRIATATIFGIKVEVGTAWAIDSAGNRQVFDIFSIGVESEVLEIAGGHGLLISDAASVADLGGISTSIGGSGGPSGIGFGAEYTVGDKYSGVTLYSGASYGIAPIGAYGLKETWTPASP